MLSVSLSRLNTINQLNQANTYLKYYSRGHRIIGLLSLVPTRRRSEGALGTMSGTFHKSVRALHECHL